MATYDRHGVSLLPGSAALENKKSPLQIHGLQQLEVIFKQFPYAFANRARTKGLRKAGRKLVTLMRRDMPRTKGKGGGNLRRSMGVKWHRKGKFVTVGLNKRTKSSREGEILPPRFQGVRYYYKTLEYGYSGRPGSPFHSFFKESWQRYEAMIETELIDQTMLALSEEAGKAWSKSNSSLRRR